MLDAGFQVAVHRLQKILAMVWSVETEYGTAQHPLQQLFAPWADAE